jgi:hypothetical protein
MTFMEIVLTIGTAVFCVTMLYSAYTLHCEQKRMQQERKQPPKPV